MFAVFDLLVVWQDFTEKQRCLHTTSGFAKLGGGMTTQTVAGTRTVGDNPNGVWLHPQHRKAASPVYASQRSAVGKRR
jgi:hypothetical protein